MQSSIHSFKRGVRFGLMHVKKLKLTSRFLNHHFTIQNLNHIFCSDIYLRKLNKKFLNHDYFTDVITFDNSTTKKVIEADIYISIHRILANAKQYNTGFNDELL